jgi:hypothetical protein
MDDADVRRALRALVDGPTVDPASAVADATDARDDVAAAAAFVERGGLARLRAAIETAERNGDRRLARRGRWTLAELERCRRAAGDHFHPARGTVLGGDQQSESR